MARRVSSPLDGLLALVVDIGRRIAILRD
jgi:hypothetical protein